MTYARSQLVEETTPGLYRCMSRCVRRSFIIGEAHYTGQNFDHRKAWIEDRLYLLAEPPRVLRRLVGLSQAATAS